MTSSIRWLAALLALPVLLAAAGRGPAQVVCATPAPAAVSYYYPPAVSYYPAPAVTYAAPAVTYAPPAVSYYTPAVSYYATPAAVSYYAPAPVVSYYAPSATVTTYRYGVLPRRRVTVTNYYSPVLVTP